MEGKEKDLNDGLDIEFNIDAIEDVDTGKVEETPAEEPKAEEPVEEPAEKKEELEDIQDPVRSETSGKENEPEPKPEPEDDSVAESEEEASVVSEIMSKLGYEVEGDFEDSTEGIIELTKAASEKIAEETLDAIFSNHPTVKQHLDFVMAGGDPNKFMATQGEAT